MGFISLVIFCVLILIIFLTIQKLRYISKELDKATKLNSKNELLYLKEFEKQTYMIGKVERQIKEKTIELAIKSKDVEEKKLLIEMVRSKVTDALANPSKSINRLHEIDLQLEKYLKVIDHTFELQMNELNQEFIKQLKLKFPEITPLDQKICLYIKSGMSSQEMANVMNVLPSSIYISRSRLRKKMGIEINQDLFGFLVDLDKPH